MVVLKYDRYHSNRRLCLCDSDVFPMASVRPIPLGRAGGGLDGSSRPSPG